MFRVRTIMTLVALFAAGADRPLSAGEPGPGVCQCERCQQLRGGQTYGAPGGAWRGRNGGSLSPLAPRTFGLPVGRPYYGGRYFGNYNNRWYLPQYGYF